MPTDPVDLVVIYTNGWPGDFHDPDTDYDRQVGGDHHYTEREACRLADTIASNASMLDGALERLAAMRRLSILFRADWPNWRAILSTCS